MMSLPVIFSLVQLPLELVTLRLVNAHGLGFIIAFETIAVFSIVVRT